jgi:hypothetical protein
VCLSVCGLCEQRESVRSKGVGVESQSECRGASEARSEAFLMHIEVCLIDTNIHALSFLASVCACFLCVAARYKAASKRARHAGD